MVPTTGVPSGTIAVSNPAVTNAASLTVVTSAAGSSLNPATATVTIKTVAFSSGNATLTPTTSSYTAFTGGAADAAIAKPFLAYFVLGALALL